MIGVGDKVVCVDASPPDRRPDLPALQLRCLAVYRVTDTWTNPPSHGQHILVDGEPIHFHDGGGFPIGWRADRFRKILPDKHEACEDEFVILLKLSKQRVSA